MDDFQAKVDAGVSPMEKEFPIIGRQRSVIFHLAYLQVGFNKMMGL